MARAHPSLKFLSSRLILLPPPLLYLLIPNKLQPRPRDPRKCNLHLPSLLLSPRPLLKSPFKAKLLQFSPELSNKASNNPVNQVKQKVRVNLTDGRTLVALGVTDGVKDIEDEVGGGADSLVSLLVPVQARANRLKPKRRNVDEICRRRSGRGAT